MAVDPFNGAGYPILYRSTYEKNTASGCDEVTISGTLKLKVAWVCKLIGEKAQIKLRVFESPGDKLIDVPFCHESEGEVQYDKILFELSEKARSVYGLNIPKESLSVTTQTCDSLDLAKRVLKPQ
jgi:hypothetical protein